MNNDLNYEDQEPDELVYDRCSECGQLEELSFDGHLCLVCEGHLHEEWLARTGRGNLDV